MEDMQDFWLIIGITAAVLVAVFLFAIWWKIFKKAGYSGALGLLMYVPLINLVLLLVLAFSKWPIELQLEQYERQLGIPPHR